MRNLIFANFTRLKKKASFFRAGIIVSSLYTVFLLIMNYLEMTAFGRNYNRIIKLGFSSRQYQLLLSFVPYTVVSLSGQSIVMELFVIS